MNSAAIQTICRPDKCPLCGKSNDCQLCTDAAYKGPCWCATAKIPDELITRVPPDFQNKACICRACVTAFHQERADAPSQSVRSEDFYFNSDGLMVFTAAYHLRRGYCCGSNCRHCPYVGTPLQPKPITT